MVAIGEAAPNFDLTSTEDVLLMLRDEVPRTAVVLYVSADPTDEPGRRDLSALAARHDALLALRAKVLVLSAAPLAGLKAVQRDLRLPFALLHDDRGFSKAYGVEPASAGAASPPALYLIGRDQKVAWARQPAGDVAAALAALEAQARRQRSSVVRYPKSVVNRLVGWWVH